MPSSLKPVENPRHAASPPPERPPSSPAPDSPAQNAKSAEQALIDRAAEAQSRELVTVTLERGADGRLGLNVDRTPGGYPVVVAPVPDGLESGDVVMLIGGRPVPETVTLAEALGPPQPTHEVTVLRHSASPRRPAAANHAMLRGATTAWFAELLVLMAVLRYDAASAALGLPTFGPLAALTEALWSAESSAATTLAVLVLASWATLALSLAVRRAWLAAVLLAFPACAYLARGSDAGVAAVTVGALALSRAALNERGTPLGAPTAGVLIAGALPIALAAVAALVYCGVALGARIGAAVGGEADEDLSTTITRLVRGRPRRPLRARRRARHRAPAAAAPRRVGSHARAAARRRRPTGRSNPSTTRATPSSRARGCSSASRQPATLAATWAPPAPRRTRERARCGVLAGQGEQGDRWAGARLKASGRESCDEWARWFQFMQASLSLSVGHTTRGTPITCERQGARRAAARRPPTRRPSHTTRHTARGGTKHMTHASAMAARAARPARGIYLYLALAASESFAHPAPSSLPTSPKVALGLAFTIDARSFLQKFMYGDGARFGLRARKGARVRPGAHKGKSDALIDCTSWGRHGAAGVRATLRALVTLGGGLLRLRDLLGGLLRDLLGDLLGGGLGHCE